MDLYLHSTIYLRSVHRENFTFAYYLLITDYVESFRVQNSKMSFHKGYLPCITNNCIDMTANYVSRTYLAVLKNSVGKSDTLSFETSLPFAVQSARKENVAEQDACSVQ